MSCVIFIETPTFEAEREQHFSDSQFAAFQKMLADHPEMGDRIPGGGGLRKVRVAMAGRGKRGGGRVIYLWRVSESQILLVAVFAKNVKTDLTPAQLKMLVKAYAGQE
jgi:plasmid stabilization system protein ParE